MNNSQRVGDAPAVLTVYKPRPDQAQRWSSYTTPISFPRGAADVLDAHASDGTRSDVVAVDVRSWVFGSEDGETMQIARMPLPAAVNRHRSRFASSLSLSSVRK